MGPVEYIRIGRGKVPEFGETVIAETQFGGAIEHQIECSDTTTPHNVLVLLRIRKYLGFIRDATRCTCVAALSAKEDCANLAMSLHMLIDSGRIRVLRRMADYERAFPKSIARPAPISIRFLHSAKTVVWEQGSGAIRLTLQLEPDLLDQIKF